MSEDGEEEVLISSFPLVCSPLNLFLFLFPLPLITLLSTNALSSLHTSSFFS